MWAVRCLHEGQMHDSNCSVTLTYRDEELVYGADRPTLVPEHLQLFMKRLRKERGTGIKFFACGEYGERTRRPHYHAILFGVDFPDRKFYKRKGGNDLFVSNQLESIWKLGDCKVGNLTFESAAYIARYIIGNKLTSQSELLSENVQPEFLRMSRGGRDGHGIGYSWYSKYKSDVFPNDYCVVRNGIKVKPPRYYSKLFEVDFPEQYAKIKRQRLDLAYDRKEDNTISRLRDKEKVKLSKLKQFSRDSN